MGTSGIGATTSSRLALTLALAGSLLSACAWLPRPTKTTEPPAEVLVADARARGESLEHALEALTERCHALERERTEIESRLERQNRQLRDSAGEHQAAARQAEVEIARLQLRLLEKEVHLDVMTQRLDAAIREVVRAMSKLRSLEGKAEAASNLAEVEIALELLGQESAGHAPNPDAPEAERHLKLASKEFRKGNYGGALYLAAQAKGLIGRGSPVTVVNGEPPRLEGEKSFSPPLPLRILATSNVRVGPGLNREVAFVASKGTPVVASSFKGLWVRVQADDGRSGWISYRLVGTP